MRGNGVKDLMAENVLAATPDISTHQYMHRKWKMCWSCQKEKSTTGGHMKIVPGMMKFVCKECMDAKKEKK